MSKSTYLELCQELARELRIPGTGPSAVTGQTGELEKIVRYVANANRDICRRWTDWDFLWTTFSTTTVLDSNSLTDGSPADLRKWDENSFVYDPTSDDYTRLSFIDYRDDYRQKVLGTQTSDVPAYVTIRPDRAIRIYPQASVAGKTVQAEYWKIGTELTADSTTSDIPEEHERLILVRAKIYYAESEDAPEIMASALAEHDDLLNILEANHLPDQDMRNMARATTNEPIRPG